MDVQPKIPNAAKLDRTRFKTTNQADRFVSTELKIPTALRGKLDRGLAILRKDNLAFSGSNGDFEFPFEPLPEPVEMGLKIVKDNLHLGVKGGRAAQYDYALSQIVVYGLGPDDMSLMIKDLNRELELSVRP